MCKEQTQRMSLYKQCKLCYRYTKEDTNFPVSGRRTTTSGTTIYYSSYCHNCSKVKARFQHRFSKRIKMEQSDLELLYGKRENWIPGVEDMLTWPEPQRPGRPRKAKVFESPPKAEHGKNSQEPENAESVKNQ